MVVVGGGALRRAVSSGWRRVGWRAVSDEFGSVWRWGLRGGSPENGCRGRWDSRSKRMSWCCGGRQVGRYFSRKVVTGLGRVWNVPMSGIWDSFCEVIRETRLIYIYLDVLCVG